MNREKELLYRFIATKRIRGKWMREVPINRLNGKDPWENCLGFRIDAVCIALDGTLWLIEVKRELTRELLGQILTDSYLVHSKHRKAVIVDEVDQQMEEIFRHYNIEVFEV
ncbi:MAG: hypothetical protein DRO95_03220 [Candidatus Altiarchaeales archaeon]|nr:MAG: hypothetical protein DRO95_03220 [Candidatus Altiarchaeales archaeon]